MRVVTVREPVPRLPNGRIGISDWLESGGHRRVVRIVALVDQLRSHLAPALVPSGFLDASVVLPAPVEAQMSCGLHPCVLPCELARSGDESTVCRHQAVPGPGLIAAWSTTLYVYLTSGSSHSFLSIHNK